MMQMKQAADEFLASRRIAVTGVSHAPSGHGSNAVYLRLRERGYQVFAVNPTAATVEGDPCYPELGAIPGGVDAVVIATRPDHAVSTMEDVISLGIPRVWMHRGFGQGSVSAEATRLGRDHGVIVIDGGCPLMYGPTSDGGHRFMCRILSMTGKVPRTIE
jgi:predicted CoA-binding protein